MKRICYVFCIILVLFLISACVAANSNTQKETSNVIGNSSVESEPQPEDASVAAEKPQQTEKGIHMQMCSICIYPCGRYMNG